MSPISGRFSLCGRQPFRVGFLSLPHKPPSTTTSHESGDFALQSGKFCKILHVAPTDWKSTETVVSPETAFGSESDPRGLVHGVHGVKVTSQVTCRETRFFSVSNANDQPRKNSTFSRTKAWCTVGSIQGPRDRDGGDPAVDPGTPVPIPGPLGRTKAWST